jgi:hypothetical protein
MSLSLQEVADRAPSVFANTHNMTDRYSQVRTIDLLEPLMERGFEIVSARQDNPRRRNPEHVTHSLNLTLPGFAGWHKEGRPEILITNSHNGRTKLRMMAGIYRLVCTNGLVVGRSFFEPVAVSHYEKQVSGAVDTALKVGDALERVAKVVDSWSEIELKATQQIAFAQQAAQLRFGESAGAYDTSTLLEARRETDIGDDLWRVYNRVQENTVRGGMAGANANGRAVRSRGMTAILPTLQYNSDLWDLASTFADAA